MGIRATAAEIAPKRRMEVYGFFGDIECAYPIYNIKEGKRSYAALSCEQLKRLKRKRTSTSSTINVFKLVRNCCTGEWSDNTAESHSLILEVAGTPKSSYEVGLAALDKAVREQEGEYLMPVTVFSIEGVPDAPITIEPLTPEQVQNLLKLRDEVNREYPR